MRKTRGTIETPRTPSEVSSKSLFHLREQFPVLNDGLFLSQLSEPDRAHHPPWKQRHLHGIWDLECREIGLPWRTGLG